MTIRYSHTHHSSKGPLGESCDSTQDWEPSLSLFTLSVVRAQSLCM